MTRSNRRSPAQPATLAGTNLRERPNAAWRRWRAIAARLAFVATGGLGSLLPASAATPTVDIAVRPLLARVSYSRPQASPPLVTYAAYEVSVVNRGASAIQGLRFSARTNVVGAVGRADFKEALRASCATNGDAASAACPIGTLAAAGGTVSFVVVFGGPGRAASPRSEGRIELPWTLSYTESPGTVPGTPVARTQTGSTLTTLGTPINTQVRAYVPSGGGTLFTGTSGLPNATTDRWTTTVRIPKAARAEIIETFNDGSCSPLFGLCIASTLRIPGSFDQLVITLRRDANTVTPGAKIKNAVLTYQREVFDAATQTWRLVGTPEDIVSCDLLPHRRPNAGTKRCLDYRRAYPTTNPSAPALAGDWEFGLKALENGRISW